MVALTLGARTVRFSVDLRWLALDSAPQQPNEASPTMTLPVQPFTITNPVTFVNSPG